MATKTAIKCGKLFDGQTQTVQQDVVLFIEGNKITDIQPLNKAGDFAGYEVIDLSDKFVTPGLIDCHGHLGMNGEASGTATMPYQTIPQMTLKGLRMAQATFMAGFTSFRTSGDMGFSDVAVRNAINAGEFMGPRLMVPGPCLGSTGGHADTHYNPYIHEDWALGLVGDGADQFRRHVRYVIKHGADYVKFMSTGGVMSLGTTLGAQQLTYDEIKAIVETADMYGCTTATHAHGTNGIKDAVRAGVTSVEHGMILDDECIELMVEKGTYHVPTIIAAHQIVTKGPEIGVADWAIKKAQIALDAHKEGFRKGHKAGVKIAFGTDVGTPFNTHGDQAFEFELLTEFGLTPLEALTSATKTASELMRKDDVVGTLEVGKYADVVAFPGDPTEDIKVMMNCCFIMKDGKVYKG